MGDIYGPYDENDFRVMQRIKKTIAYDKAADPILFAEAIKKEKYWLDHFMFSHARSS